MPKHVPRCDLSLSLGNCPVFNPDLLPGTRIGPSSNVASRVNARLACFQILVDENASIDRQPSLICEYQQGPNPGSDDYEIRIQCCPIAEGHVRTTNVIDCPAHVKNDTVRLVEFAKERSDLNAKNPLQRLLFRRYNMNLDLPSAQRGRYFESDKAGPYHHRTLRRRRIFGNGFAV